MLALKGLENADGAVGIQHPLAVLLDELELARRGVVEGQDNGSGPSANADFAVNDIVESDQAVASLPKPLEVTPEVRGGAGPALFGLIDLVILEDHDAPELVRWKITGGGRRGQDRRSHERDDTEEAKHA
jgi:hypothetical protein